MNAPVRRLSLVVAALFASLLVSTTLIQYVFAADLNARPDNRRTLLSTFARERGEILVGQTAVAKSVPVDDEYKYQRVYPEGRALRPRHRLLLVLRRVRRPRAGRERAAVRLERQALLPPGVRPVHRSPAAGRQPRDHPRRQGAGGGRRRPRGHHAAPRWPSTRRPAPSSRWSATRRTTPTTWPATTSTAVDKNYDSAQRGPRQAAASTARSTATSTRPGSVFKVVTAAAALSTGRVHRELRCCPARRCSTCPDDRADLPNASTAAVRPERARSTMTRGARGLVQHRVRAGSGMEHRRRGAAVRRRRSSASATRSRCRCGSRRARVPAELNLPQLAQSSIGQYDVRVDAAADGDGRRRRRQPTARSCGPTSCSRSSAPTSSVIESADPQELSQAVTPEVAAQLTRMMEAVVEDGTGGRGPDPRRRRRRQDRHRPARRGPQGARLVHLVRARPNDPEIAVAVIAEDGGVAGSEAGGGTVAAPIAKQMMEAQVEPMRESTGMR